MDRITPQHRSWNMSRIRGENTGPEIRVRKALHRMGYRFRLHRRDLPGRPDIVLPKYKTVLLVHGCYWHRHEGCRFAYTPKTRPEFWQRKFQENVERDRKQLQALQALSWRVEVIWECETADPRLLQTRLTQVLSNRSPSSPTKGNSTAKNVQCPQ